jgi:post-segregation antitoxin (ccd killing protein)
MAHLSIWVSDDLKARVRGNRRINVSAVCREALEARLGVEATEPEGMEVVEDLYKWARQGRRLLGLLEDFLA